MVQSMMQTSGDAAAAPPPRLSLCTIAWFILPALALAFMHGPEMQMQGIYAKHAGLTLAALAGATLLTRAFDAITYPVIGYLSDLSYARMGTRKPWVVGGALLSALGVWFLYRPPADVGIGYYVAWTGVTYLGWKTAEIPYQACAVEGGVRYTIDCHSRTAIDAPGSGSRSEVAAMVAGMQAQADGHLMAYLEGVKSRLDRGD